MQITESSRLLRMSLLSNALFSTVSGVAFIVASGPIAAAIGLPYPGILVAIGVSLLLFAAGLFTNARRDNVNLTEARVAVALDFAWVVGSAVVIAAGVLNTTGNWAVAMVADLVLAFAILQYVGIRRMPRTTDTV